MQKIQPGRKYAQGETFRGVLFALCSLLGAGERNESAEPFAANARET